MAGHDMSTATQAAIDARIDTIQESYTDFKSGVEALRTKVEAHNEKVTSWGDDNEPLDHALSWKKFPSDAPAEDIAAIIIYSNIEENAINHLSCPDLFEQVNAQMADWKDSDPKRYQEIVTISTKALNGFMESQQEIQQEQQALQMTAMQDQDLGGLIAGETVMSNVIVEPESEDSNKWSVATFFMICDEDGQVKVAETLPYDVSFSAEVVSNKAGLTDIFNVAAYGVPAGQKIEPFVVNVEKEDDLEYTMTINAHRRAEDGSMETQNMALIVETPEEDDMEMDPMQQMMMMMGGGGPGM